MSHLRTLDIVVSQVRIPFRPKHDPNRNLAEEIESCKRKIWECIDLAERKQFFEKKKHKKCAKQDKMIDRNEENSKCSNDHTQKLDESIKLVQKAQNQANQPPLTRTDIELKVFVMKVVELKKALKDRKKDTTGLKKDLRNRLINVILEDIHQTETQTLSKQSKMYRCSDSITVDKCQEGQEKGAGKNNKPKDLREKIEIEMSEQNKARQRLSMDKITQESENSESISSPQVENRREVTDQPREIQKKDRTHPIFSEVKQEVGQVGPTVSREECLINVESSLTAIRETDVISSNGTSSQNLDGPSTYLNSTDIKSELAERKMKSFSENKECSDLNEDTSRPPSEVSCCSKASGNSVKDMVSKFSGFSSSASSSSGSALSKGLQAKKEARQAKIAEMRAKAQSKPVTATKVALTSKEFSNTLSSLHATASTASAKKKNIATQMREKAAVRAFQNKIANSVLKTGSKTVTSTCHSNNTMSNQLGATLINFSSVKKSSSALSSMDTYEISDREDSETDDSDSESENDKPKKKIPIWAQRTTLYSALEEQYNGRIGSAKIDPDNIFPEVQSCDLEAIFGPKKSRLYKKRASSGNWANDKVTVAEKLVYKREMGFATADTDGAGV